MYMYWLTKPTALSTDEVGIDQGVNVHLALNNLINL